MKPHPYLSPPTASFTNLPRMLGTLAVVCVGVPLACWGIVATSMASPGALLIGLWGVACYTLGWIMRNLSASRDREQLRDAQECLAGVPEAMRASFGHGLLHGQQLQAGNQANLKEMGGN